MKEAGREAGFSTPPWNKYPDEGQRVVFIY